MTVVEIARIKVVWNPAFPVFIPFRRRLHLHRPELLQIVQTGKQGKIDKGCQRQPNENEYFCSSFDAADPTTKVVIEIRKSKPPAPPPRSITTRLSSSPVGVSKPLVISPSAGLQTRVITTSNSTTITNITTDEAPTISVRRRGSAGDALDCLIYEPDGKVKSLFDFFYLSILFIQALIFFSTPRLPSSQLTPKRLSLVPRSTASPSTFQILSSRWILTFYSQFKNWDLKK